MVARAQDRLRLLKQVLIGVFVWLAAATVSTIGLAGAGRGTLTRAVLAGIGIGGFLVWLWTVGKSVLAQDEFTQRVHFVALAIAFAGTALLSLSIDFLHRAGFVGRPPFSAAWIWMLGLWVVSLVGTSRYYR